MIEVELIMKFFVFLVSCLFLTSVDASQYNLPKIRATFPFNSPVVFQSQKVRIYKNTGNRAWVAGKLITRWGVRVFQVGRQNYECQRSSSDTYNCVPLNFIVLRSYEKCRVKGQKAACSGKIGSSSGARDSIIDRDRLETYEQYGDDRVGYEDVYEFPQRGLEQGSWEDNIGPWY
jgi:hypothetical protein